MLKGKGPVVILALIILICLIVIGYTASLLQSERAKSQSLEAQVENLQKIQKDLKIKLEDSKRQAADLEQQLKDSKDQIAALTSELDTEKKARQENLAQIDQIKLALEQEKAQRADLEEKLSTTQAEITKIQTQLKETQRTKAALETKVKDLEDKMQKVELGTIVIGQDGMATQAQASLPALEGKILVVNKEYNFAVINLGSKDSVNINDIFGTYSQGKYIGDVKVEKVHESMSAANFASPGIKELIAEGDKVVLKAR